MSGSEKCAILATGLANVHDFARKRLNLQREFRILARPRFHICIASGSSLRRPRPSPWRCCSSSRRSVPSGCRRARAGAARRVVQQAPTTGPLPTAASVGSYHEAVRARDALGGEHLHLEGNPHAAPSAAQRPDLPPLLRRPAARRGAARLEPRLRRDRQRERLRAHQPPRGRGRRRDRGRAAPTARSCSPRWSATTRRPTSRCCASTPRTCRRSPSAPPTRCASATWCSPSAIRSASARP